MSNLYDKRAWKTLHDMHWASGNWRDPRGKVSTADKRHAIDHHVMFAPIALKHDETIAQIKGLCRSIAPEQVGDAFLASLTTREVSLRSCLGSYTIARVNPKHIAEPNGSSNYCKHCLLPLNPPNAINVDLNVLSFERLKWGGVRHFQPEYQWFDLNEATRVLPIRPTDEDVALFREVLGLVAKLPPESTAAVFAKAIGEILPSSKQEREVLVLILGYAGVIAWPGFKHCFDGSTCPPGRPFRDTDWNGPAAYWRAKDGFQIEPLREFFPRHIDTLLR